LLCKIGTRLFVKSQNYFLLQKTWNIGTTFIINNLTWNKLGTTLHIFGTKLGTKLEQALGAILEIR
jgi:hypothetical protein